MNKTQKFLEMIAEVRLDKAQRYDYSKVEYLNNSTHIIIGCSIHGDFRQRPADHRNNIGCPKCGRLRAIETNLIKYGTPNPASSRVIKDKIRNIFIEKYDGIDNPSKVPSVQKQKEDTCLKNYGVNHPGRSAEIQQRKKRTNIEKYGFEWPMQNPGVCGRAIATKVATGGFTKSNSSHEATCYIREYTLSRGYSKEQCAYSDTDAELHEWGIYKNGRWILYDLVVFEPGHRGDKDKIIEILEYHGPFHYTQTDVDQRGSDRAYPWKSNKSTILESYERDREKENIGKTMTDKYIIVWGPRATA